MVGLGVRGDAPPSPAQPPLADGIHLRWAFVRDLGFPWYGFVLFRRPHLVDESRTCVYGQTSATPGGSAAGSTSLTTFSTPYGTFSSDTNITFTDDFPPLGIGEFDLANRSFLRFTLLPAYVSRAIVATVGFRTDGVQRTCI